MWVFSLISPWYHVRMTFQALPPSIPNIPLLSTRQWLVTLALVLLVHTYVILSPALRWQSDPEPALLPMLTRVIEVVPELPTPPPKPLAKKEPPKGKAPNQAAAAGKPLPKTPPTPPAPPVLAVEQSASPITVASAPVTATVSSKAALEALARSGLGGIGQGRGKGSGGEAAGRPDGQGEDTEKVVLTVPSQVKVPDSREWKFATTHQDRSTPIYAPDMPTILKWKVQDGKYEVYLGVDGPASFFSKLARQSTGSVGDKGLIPDTFTATAYKGAKTITYFESEAQKISFGKSGTLSRPLLPGSQDEISAAIQLATMFSGEPKRYKVGDQIAINVANRSDTQIWIFNIESDGTVDIPAGQIHAIKLTRAPRMPNDTGVTVWLSPENQYMPVRLRLDYNANRYDDIKWRGF
jgi:hypothetical protein